MFYWASRASWILKDFLNETHNVTALCWPHQLNTTLSSNNHLSALTFSVCVFVCQWGEWSRQNREHKDDSALSVCNESAKCGALNKDGIITCRGGNSGEQVHTHIKSYKTLSIYDVLFHMHSFICLSVSVVQLWRHSEMLKLFITTTLVALGNSSSFISASMETSREEESQTVSSLCALFGCVSC